MSIDLDIGFIGTGGIASAMARGFCNASEFAGKIYLSVHRNRTRAEQLKAAFPERIFISESGQEVLDKADVVVPAVLPHVLEEVTKPLVFRKSHKIIHIAGGMRLEQASSFYAPATDMVRAVPLPFAARNFGPVLVYGEDPVCRKLLSLIGVVISVKKEEDLAVLGTITGIMVPFYALLAQYIEWGEERGLDRRTSMDYCCYMCEALSEFMRTECGGDTEKFLVENSTPGGVNELALKLLREKNVYKPWSDVLDILYDRYTHLSEKN